MKKIANFLKFLNDYWTILGALAVGFWAVVGFVHTYYMKPYVIQPLVVEYAYKMFSDSTDVWSQRMLAKRPAGFRTHLSEATEIPKGQIADSVASILNEERGVKTALDEVLTYVEYEKGLNKLYLRQIAHSVDTMGVVLWKMDSGDLYYMDSYYLWKAVYYADERAFYYFDINGHRRRCE